MYPLLSPCSIHKLRLGKPPKLPPCLMKLSVYPPWLCSLCAKTFFVVDLLAVLRMPNFNQSYSWVLTMPKCKKKLKLEECFQSSNHLYEGVEKVYLWLVFCIFWKIVAYFITWIPQAVCATLLHNHLGSNLGLKHLNTKNLKLTTHLRC